jgi:hypothetical protein
MKTKLSVIAILLFVALTLGLKKEENTDTTITNPTNIANFSVQQLGRDFQLTWATNSEAKNTHLELQKSFNERQFETLALFKGVDRNTLKAYSYTDTTPFERTAHEVKIIYYRLKEVDANEIFTYSKVVSIVRDDNYDVPKPTL